MNYKNAEYVKEITAQWQGERFEDGRPKVPDAILERMRGIKLEEAWKYLQDRGYIFQFEGGLKTTRPGKKLVGRAVTTVMVPTRPDMEKATADTLAIQNKRGRFQWILDEIVENDVVVADCFDKIENCTFLGGNLTTNIARRTVNGGAVIWGGIRDLEQIMDIDIQIYYRKTDPGPMRNGVVSTVNYPCRIGNATCLPGDVVFGTVSGVLFIPAHLAEGLVISAEKTKVRDIFGFECLSTGKYTAGQIDARWSLPIWEDFMGWLKADPRAREFDHLDWTEDLEEAKGSGIHY